MTDTVRCWLVEREVDQRDLVTVVYATPDGERIDRQQFSADRLQRVDVTAARDVSEPDLEPTPEGDRNRYREEARRVRERHDPGDEI